jgi:hypothetical protein
MKSKILLTTHILILLVLVGVFTFLFWKIDSLKKNNNDTNTTSKTYIYDDHTSVELVNVDKGELENELCNSDECTIDLRISVDNIKDLEFKDFTFSGSLDIPKVIPNTKFDEDITYVRISSGTGVTRSTVIFNNVNEKRYNVCMAGEAYILNSKNVFFNDCGTPGNNVELVQGISVLNLDTGNITKVLEEKVGTEDVSYLLEKIMENKLIYYENVFSFNKEDEEFKNSVDVKSLDLFKYI